MQLEDAIPEFDVAHTALEQTLFTTGTWLSRDRVLIADWLLHPLSGSDVRNTRQTYIPMVCHRARILQ